MRTERCASRGLHALPQSTPKVGFKHPIAAGVLELDTRQLFIRLHERLLFRVSQPMTKSVGVSLPLSKHPRLDSQPAYLWSSNCSLPCMCIVTTRSQSAETATSRSVCVHELTRPISRVYCLKTPRLTPSTPPDPSWVFLRGDHTMERDRVMVHLQSAAAAQRTD